MRTRLSHLAGRTLAQAQCRPPSSSSVIHHPARCILTPKSRSSSSSSSWTAAVPEGPRHYRPDTAIPTPSDVRKQLAQSSRSGWKTTIGLELHVQLKSPVKLFSRAVTSFDDTPNKNVAALDAALPGTLPVRAMIPYMHTGPSRMLTDVLAVQVLNVEPVKLAVLAALAMGCEVHQKSKYATPAHCFMLSLCVAEVSVEPDSTESTTSTLIFRQATRSRRSTVRSRQQAPILRTLSAASDLMCAAALATNGRVQLSPRHDGLDAAHTVRVSQVQLEQVRRRSCNMRI